MQGFPEVDTTMRSFQANPLPSTSITSRRQQEWGVHLLRVSMSTEGGAIVTSGEEVIPNSVDVMVTK